MTAGTPQAEESLRGNPTADSALVERLREQDVSALETLMERYSPRLYVNYAASKGGVKLLMQTLAQELAPHRIRINSIAPGAIQTPINRAAWETPEALRSLLELIPYGRIGQPEDIGKAVVWLASDDADYIQGQTIFVDGGMTLYPEFAKGG